MLAVRKLAKRFGDVVALQDVSFEVGRGEIVGFLGPNGAGKTTTLRILSTYLTPDTGSATIGGDDTAREPMAVRRKLGYLPEHPPLYLDHTVREYLGFCAALRGVPRRRRRAAVDSAIGRCALGEVRDRLLGNLSKGFRQRVGLAQALVHGPQVLVLDEPTVGLDPQQIREIRELIRSLGGEHTVLLSTHILPEVAAVCGRAIIVQRGRVVADAPLAELSGTAGLEEAFLRVTAADAPVEEAPA